MRNRRSPRPVPLPSIALMGAALLVSACRTPLPSLVDRLPASRLDPGQWEEIEKGWNVGAPPRAPSPGAGGEEGSAEIERVVVRVTIVGSDRRESAARMDAAIPGEEARFILRCRVDEVLEGALALPELRLGVRSPLEEFAYPLSGVVQFTLTLACRKDGRGLRRVEGIDPTGADLLEGIRRLKGPAGRGPRTPGDRRRPPRGDRGGPRR